MSQSGPTGPKHPSYLAPRSAAPEVEVEFPSYFFHRQEEEEGETIGGGSFKNVLACVVIMFSMPFPALSLSLSFPARSYLTRSDDLTSRNSHMKGSGLPVYCFK